MPLGGVLNSHVGRFAQVLQPPRADWDQFVRMRNAPMSATATLTEQAPNRLAGFVPVQIRTLRSTQTDAADLFVQYEPNAEPVLYCRAGSRPDEQQFTELAEGGVESLYVRSDDFSNLSNDVLESLDSLLKRDDICRTE